MEILNTIDEQIKWYYDNSDKVGIDELLTLQDKLSVNSYYLSQLYAEAYKTYLEKIFNTKIKKIKSFLSKKAEKINDKQITDKLAELYATNESLNDYLVELLKEGEKEKLRVLLQQVNQILFAIQQRISNLKLEKQNFKS